MKITGAVFDFGGVMTTMTTPDYVRPLAERLGVAWSVLTDGFDRYRRFMDGDLISITEMYGKIFADAGLSFPDETIDEIVRKDQESYCGRNEATLEFMRSLKSEGFKIGILTNMCSSFVPHFRKHFADYIELADAMVISGHEKMHKPEKRIYELLRERIALPAEELCFFDDVSMNCEGARADGWQCIRFESTEQAKSDFEVLLGKIRKVAIR